jgi:hypothetical protein
MELDFLRDCYEEGPTWRYGDEVDEGSVYYAFFDEMTRIRVTNLIPGTTCCHVWIEAGSKEALYRATKKVWRCGSLATTLTAPDGPSRDVLERVRRECRQG